MFLPVAEARIVVELAVDQDGPLKTQLIPCQTQVLLHLLPLLLHVELVVPRLQAQDIQHVEELPLLVPGRVTQSSKDLAAGLPDVPHPLDVGGMPSDGSGFPDRQDAAVAGLHHGRVVVFLGLVPEPGGFQARTVAAEEPLDVPHRAVEELRILLSPGPDPLHLEQGQLTVLNVQDNTGFANLLDLDAERPEATPEPQQDAQHKMGRLQVPDEGVKRGDKEIVSVESTIREEQPRPHASVMMDSSVGPEPRLSTYSRMRKLR